MKKLISLIIPCYNESEGLDILCPALCRVAEQMPNYCFEILLIDDGSQDDTLEKK